MRIKLTQTTFDKVYKSFGIEAGDNLKHLQLYFNQDFDDKFPCFEWFKDALPHIDSILHLGCNLGKETFALAWGLKVHKIEGIDSVPEKIEYARERVRIINYFRKPVIEQFQTWYKAIPSWYEEIPYEIREGVLPKFRDALDFSLPIPENYFEPDNYFDLVYCRYCLYQIAKKGQNYLHSACQNIRNIVRPETGRVVIIEPTNEKNVTYEFKKCLQDAGLTLLMVEEEDGHLGRREIDNLKNRDKGLASPKGYILKREKAR